MLDTRNVHSLTDFLRNHKVHMARIKDSKAAEVLTVHGRPEAVLMGTATYEDIMDRLHHFEEIASIRADFARARKDNPPAETVSDEEMQRRRDVMNELVAETERLGLYR